MYNYEFSLRVLGLPQTQKGMQSFMSNLDVIKFNLTLTMQHNYISSNSPLNACDPLGPRHVGNNYVLGSDLVDLTD